jgi:NADH dehydrogenase
MNITIVGGGFGGVKAALELAKHANNQITLISDKPDFQYYPALYGTATGGSHLQSWVPLSEIFANYLNITVQLDAIETIDKTRKTLTGTSGVVYTYETVILALGSVTTYFGIDGLETFAYGIKSAKEIDHLKQHLYAEFTEKGRIDGNFVIVGAGPTGVELAAALGSYLRRLADHYGKPSHDMKISLVEAAPRVLPKMSEKTSHKVARRLHKLGVHVEVDKKVESATVDTLMVSGKPIKTHTVIWTSGVANHPFYKNNAAQFQLARNGRVIVDEHMQIGEHVYVIGDNAVTPFGGLAQTALHDALFVSRDIQRVVRGKSRRSYKAVMPPSVVPVGENWAVFEWHKIHLYGWLASLIRRAADFIGYNDILPLGQALGVWHAQRIKEEDNFALTKTSN